MSTLGKRLIASVKEARASVQSARFEGRATTKSRTKMLVVCISNEGHPASLEKQKIYVALRDVAAAKLGLLGIVDESGDDYLYPKALFRTIALPDAAVVISV